MKVPDPCLHTPLRHLEGSWGLGRVAAQIIPGTSPSPRPLAHSQYPPSFSPAKLCFHFPVGNVSGFQKAALKRKVSLEQEESNGRPTPSSPLRGHGALGCEGLSTAVLVQAQGRRVECT